MTRQIRIFAGVIFLLAFGGLAGRAGEESAKSPTFAVANVHFEQNATDGDAEVVFEVKGGNVGLAKLAVVSPDGRTVIDLSAPDASTLGIRQFRFESPEPGDVESLKAAYPEGVYTFDGATAAGDKLHSESTLSHELPIPASFLHPGAELENVSVKNFTISWTPVKNLSAYILYIEQDELDIHLTTKLPDSVTAFAVPNGFLLLGREYQLGIGTVSQKGNISFVETNFSTAGEE